MRIYQITDLHVPTQDDSRWQQVTQNITGIMSHIAAYPPDLLVITGDLSMVDGCQTSCEWLRSVLPEQVPYTMVPGNHDSIAILDRVFENRLGQQHEFCFKLPAEGADLLFVNSNTESLPESQIELIRQQAADDNALLFIHHPPDLISDGFMANSQPLKNWREVAAAIAQSGVSHVFCGHYHNAMDKVCDGFELHLTPSPAFQISLEHRQFTLEPTIPRLRVIDCTPAGISTELKTVEISA